MPTSIYQAHISLFTLVLLLLMALFSACRDDDESLSLTEQDRNFAMEATYSNKAAVEWSQVAVEQASSEPLRSFAQQLIEEHTAAQLQLQQIATEQELLLPAAIRIEDQAFLDQLLGLSGNDFDSGYLASLISFHQQTQQLFEEQIERGSHPQLVAYASTLLPQISMHLQEALELQESLEPEDGE
jgi:putative membrane protein